MKIWLLACLCLPVFAAAQAKKKVAVKNSSSLQTSLLRGKVVYATFCLSCHQSDGSGVPNMNPPLTAAAWVAGPKVRLIQQVLHGSRGKVEIDGETFHNTMPAQAHLTDEQIADVLSFVRNSFGNKASIVTPAEVKTIRAKK